MRIAVLISGEYRTFGLCRKTMKFLDDPQVDIYFSTWDKSEYSSYILNFKIEEDVTLDRIKKDLGKDAVIEIEPHDLIVETRYNSKMIHRWKRGIELVKKSGINYDYVLVIRPDLYFDGSIDYSFTNIGRYHNALASTWAHRLDIGFLNDVMFLSSFERICLLLDNLSVELWATNMINADWHTWWYTYTRKHFDEIIDFRDLGICTFCRYWVKESDTFNQIRKAQEDWSDLRVSQIASVVPDVVDKNWPPEIVSRAHQKWKSGVYDKYKPNVALVISGMLRNYDTALLSLPIWGDCDKFLVTWESAGQEAIDDYVRKAKIHRKYIVSDSEFEKVYRDPYKNGNNTFRMVYLWENAAKYVPEGYDRYVIIRPDGFYWTTNPNKVNNLIRTLGPFKVNQTRYEYTAGINDHLIVADKSNFLNLKTCYTDLINAAKKMIDNGTANNKYGAYLDPHELLFTMWNQKIDSSEINTDRDFCSSELDSCIEALWVRNTFQPFATDVYGDELYKAVFYDTAAFWRRSARCNYHGTLNRLKYD